MNSQQKDVNKPDLATGCIIETGSIRAKNCVFGRGTMNRQLHDGWTNMEMGGPTLKIMAFDLLVHLKKKVVSFHLRYIHYLIATTLDN